ncbi:MAG TPA: GDSL-type esterase/lipase family protein [Allosphingosinicella sp.]|nr:GDSL-type esterase/lipase family protein [Allosphingosinicella sp.]
MLSLIGAAAAVAVAQAPDQVRCNARLCYGESLAPFLARLRASRRESGQPVHIIQIGDSHTAGDNITNGWRSRLQTRHGAGGRGALAAGRPYAGYLTWGVTARQTSGWSVSAIFGSRYREGGPALGISGFTQTASAPGQTIGVSADSPDQYFDRVVLCAVAQPGGGTIQLRMGEEERRWSLNAPRRLPACHAVDSAAPVSSVSVTTEDDGPVSITSIGTFRRRGGVILSNLGVVGAQLTHFGRTDDAVVRAELAAYRPDLIVLAFGTNEGFSASGGGDAYEAVLRAQIARIRRLAGAGVPILLLGPPDAATRQAAIADPSRDCGDGWFEPRGLSLVRERQLRVARQMRVAFWNWAAAMGGRCAAHQWRLTEQMRGDHVHFSRSGGDRIGGMIDADFVRALAAAGSGPQPAGDRRRP